MELAAEAACLAARVKSGLLEKGIEEEIEVPVKKTTLMKVMEYMKYHSENAPSDVRLVSDNFSECGASKWDINFISVDKVVIVELLYASNALDIPTLSLLAKVKMSIMMLNKAPDQIRKEFNFANDLSKTEETELNNMVRDLRKKRNINFEEEAGIAPATAMVGTVWKLAEAHGQKANDTAVVPADGRSWRQGAWRAAVVEDWHQLEHAPEQARNDRELILAAMTLSCGKALEFASQALKADRDVVTAAVSADGASFVHASASLQGDREFVAEMLKIDGAALVGASPELRSDRSFILEAVRFRQGSALKGADESLRNDASFVLQCAAEDPDALEHASDKLRNDPSFGVLAAGTIAGALRRLPAKLRANYEVVDAALRLDPSSVYFAHASRRSDFESSELAVAEPATDGYNGPWHLGGQTWSSRKVTKTVVFTAMSTMSGNFGQSNYVAANSFLDKIPAQQRPEIDAVGLMWGTVGGIGMRWKAFASADVMYDTPDLLMGVNDAKKVLHVVATTMEVPEWVATNYLDPEFRNSIVGQERKGGFKLSSEQVEYPRVRRRPLRSGDFESGGVPTPPGHAPEAPSSRVATLQRRSDGKRREDEEASDAPLDTWPSLSSRAATEAVKEEEPIELIEGTAVILTGLKNKSGTTGIITKCYPEGRFKVCLDDKKRSSALLKPEYLIPIAPPQAVCCH